MDPIQLATDSQSTPSVPLGVHAIAIDLWEGNEEMKKLAILGLSALLAACGGGGGGATSAVPASVLSGTAATGAALANASVAITNSSGNSPCQETSITTTALGSYTCTLKAGEKAPFFVVVTDPTGHTAPLVSIATTTPSAGTPLTVNATPLTTAIVAQLAADGNPLTVVSSKTVDATALQAVTSNVVAQLAAVLTAINAPAGYDPFTTSITAATASGTGNTADLVLDVVKVVTDPATGKPALSTLTDPTPVVLATATTTGSTVAAPTTDASTLSQAAQIAAQTLQTCFALPTTQRVLSTNTTIPAALGGQAVTSVAPECQEMVAQASNAAGIDFLHNGYNAGQFFYNILTSDAMTGAQFSVPEIVAFYAADPLAAPSTPAAYDRAVVNIKYVDSTGIPGNVITLAARIPGTSSTTRPTEWWLVGNQLTVDVNVRLSIRQTLQVNTTPIAGAAFSTYQNGLNVLVRTDGPGSVNANGALTLARVTGPGLPAAGIVFKTSSNAALTNMDLWNKSGSLTTGSQCGNGTNSNCPLLWFSRTQGVTGTAATTLTGNPSNGAFNLMIWAQPADGVDPTKFVKGTAYTIELFYGSNTGTADLTVTKVLLSDLVQATQAVNLPWNSLGTQSTLALDPNGSLAGAQTSLLMDWVQNPSAQPIGGIGAATGAGISPIITVPKVASSATLTLPPGVTIPAFTTTTPRALLFNYRLLDGSYKSAFYTYN